MNLESQVCSTEISKKLKELGVKQESLFYWIETKMNNKFVLAHSYEYHHNSFNLDSNELKDPRVNSIGCDCCSMDWEIVNKYSAFTVSELMQLLPHRIILEENDPYNSFRLRIEKSLWVKESNISNINIIIPHNLYIINYYCDTTSEKMDWLFSSLTKNICDENLSNTCAKMLIHLYEKGLIKNDN